MAQPRAHVRFRPWHGPAADAAAGAAESGGGEPSGERPGRDIAVGDRRVRVYESGPDQPAAVAVLILTGAGDTPASWALVQDQLPPTVRLIRYDRSGMGGSGAAPGRTLDDHVAEIHGVLAAVGVDGPTVVVGHSLGGLLARGFQAAHPGAVAGLVLVDSTPPVLAVDPTFRFWFSAGAVLVSALHRCARIGVLRALFAVRAMPVYPEQTAFKSAASPPDYRRWVREVCVNYRRDAAREFAAVRPVAEQFLRSRRLRAGTPSPTPTPVRVLCSRAFGARWERRQREVAAEYPGGVTVATGDRFHNIHLKHPHLVVAAVQAILAGLPRS